MRTVSNMNYQHADSISAAAGERQQGLNTNTCFLDQDKDLITGACQKEWKSP